MSQTPEENSTTKADRLTPGTPAMNKSVLIVLVIAAVGLGGFLMFRAEPDTRPDLPDEDAAPLVDEFMRLEGGVETDEPGTFHVDVEPKTSGAQHRLEFTVSELNGWGAKGVYIKFWHQVMNEESGEWEPDPAFTPVTFMSKLPLQFGEPLIYETALTSIEMNELNGDFGPAEEWAAEVAGCLNVYKPE